MLLKYNLLPFKNAFIFQILGQDAGLSEYVKMGGPYYASNGWKVRIDAEPEICKDTKTIYLRGYDSSKDLKVDRWCNLDGGDRERDQLMNAVNQALEELVSSYKYSSYSYPYNVSPKRNGNPLAYANKLTGKPVNVTEEEVIYVRLW